MVLCIGDLTPSLSGPGRVDGSMRPCSTRNLQKLLAAKLWASFLLAASPQPMKSKSGTLTYMYMHMHAVGIPCSIKWTTHCRTSNTLEVNQYI